MAVKGGQTIDVFGVTCSCHPGRLSSCESGGFRHPVALSLGGTSERFSGLPVDWSAIGGGTEAWGSVVLPLSLSLSLLSETK